MVDATVVVAPVVVVGPTVVGVAVAMVVTGTTVSASPLHPEATKRNIRTTAYCLTVSVCHPFPEGVVGVFDALGVDTRRQRALALSDVDTCVSSKGW